MKKPLILMERKEFIERPNGTQFVHASTNLCLTDGSVIVAWFSGSAEGSKDVRIYHTRKERGKWSTITAIEDHIDQPHWNPVLFSLSDEQVILFYKVGKKINEWQTYYCISKDGGKTFSASQILVPEDNGGRGPVRNKPIRLSNGDIAAPASKENGIWHAFVDLSRDEGRTWRKSSLVSIKDLIYDENQVKVTESQKRIPVSEQSFYGRGVIQPTLWESESGHVHMLLRSSEGHIYRSDSEDFGRTWSYAYRTDLPNNNSGIDLVKIDNGLLLLVFNPVKKNWGERSPLSVAVSEDNGKTWKTIRTLDTGDGEFSYPAITHRGNRIFISYSHKRERIAFWEFEIDNDYQNRI